jgi:yecA family protein
MKRLPINFPDLQQALEDSDNSSSALCWLDTLTGRVIAKFDDPDTEGKFQNKLERSDKHRFVPIDRIASHDSYEIMADFVGILPQSSIREKFERALGDSKPFRSFKETLLENVQVRNQWHKCHDEAVRLYAVEWLSDLGIRPIEEEEAPESNARLNSESWLQNENGIETDEDRVYLAKDLSIEEEAELVSLIEQIPGSTYTLSKLHGLLTAWIIGPVSVNPADVFSLIAGEGKPIAETIERVQYFLDLLGRFNHRIVSNLDSETFEPIIYRGGEPPESALVNLTSWGKGFVHGIEHRAADWEKWFADPRREKVITLLFGNAEFELNQSPGAFELEQIETTAYKLICTWIPLIRQYWRFEAKLDSVAIGVPKLNRHKQSKAYG